MDLKLFTKDLKEGLEVEHAMKKLKGRLQDMNDQKQGLTIEREQIFKPIVDEVRQVKETIDENQNKVIQKLAENQNALSTDLSFLKELDSFESPPESPLLLEAPPKPKTKIPDPEIGFNQADINIIKSIGFPSLKYVYQKMLEGDFNLDRLQTDVYDKAKRMNHVKAGLSKDKVKNKNKIESLEGEVTVLKKYVERINLHAKENNAAQKKTGYKFTVDSTTDATTVIDWYNTYFEMDFKLTKMDNTTYGTADAAAIINGGFSMIKDIKVDFDGASVLDLPDANHAINIKNRTEYTREYTRDMGPILFHYPDTDTGAVMQKYTTLALDGNAQNIAPTDNTNYNEGFTARKTLLAAGTENNIRIPLNRFGFFKSLEEQIAPNGKVIFNITLEDDANVLFRPNAAAEGRFIATKFVLWIPKMELINEGKKALVANYFRPHTWPYQRESVFTSLPLRRRRGTLKITNTTSKPRHVFIWVLNATKLSDEEQNMFVFNTFNTTNARTFTKAQLRLTNGGFYPKQQLDPTTQLNRAYCYLAEYMKFVNDYLSGPTIDIKQFQNLYGILYFDLSYQDPGLLPATTGLEFHFALNNALHAEYHICALVLNEEDITVDVVKEKAIIRSNKA
ncbi:hypothetical protein AWC38_SpisGene24094 [Stylophora pistillata]|uniref:Major capsid protein n=1 Tax=Stylophora pistillata TaxID=50429 RepID=A0A2B4R4D6_STYPI|nr:hypothetical protein AWC38_SpisGene24094 [Stylophora pistillata]